MKVALTLYLLAFGIHCFACSGAIHDRSSGASTPRPAENTFPNEGNPQNSPRPLTEAASSNPRDRVLFDGKNYIKKSGWKTPPKKDTYVDESYDQGSVKARTEKGTQVRTNTLLYGYRTEWLHSQDFYYQGRDLDYLKGKLESVNFLETSVNGKVFMYSITVGPLILNELDHRDPFGYQIQDRDGDGIFETLVARNVDIIVVPDWVIRIKRKGSVQ